MPRFVEPSEQLSGPSSVSRPACDRHVIDGRSSTRRLAGMAQTKTIDEECGVCQSPARVTYTLVGVDHAGHESWVYAGTDCSNMQCERWAGSND